MSGLTSNRAFNPDTASENELQIKLQEAERDPASKALARYIYQKLGSFRAKRNGFRVGDGHEQVCAGIYQLMPMIHRWK